MTPDNARAHPVSRPVFVVGVPRSGTTVLHHLLSRHSQVAWLSGFCCRYPRRPAFNRWLMAGLDWPLLGPLLRRRFRPWECYDFWEAHCPGFRRPFRDLLAEDVTPGVRTRLPRVLGQLLTTRRHRLLVKITGWPRLGFLQTIFPDARFVHIVRDGRAVASSLLRTDFWQGWRGPAQWRWGPLTTEQEARWQASGQSFVALAGLQWERLLAATEEASARLALGQFYQITYEALCAEPETVMRAVTEFCELPWTGDFARQVAAFPLHNRNDQWPAELTDGQQRLLQQTIGDCLATYGYASAPGRAP